MYLSTHLGSSILWAGFPIEPSPEDLENVKEFHRFRWSKSHDIPLFLVNDQPRNGSDLVTLSDIEDSWNGHNGTTLSTWFCVPLMLLVTLNQ